MSPTPMYTIHLALFVGFVQGFSTTLSSPQQEQQQVKVRVQRHLPIISPKEARQAWLDFVWEKGGGLPLLGVLSQQSREPTDGLETTLERRLLLPIGMEEELIIVDEEENDTVQYQVTKGGLLSTEIVPESHLGLVKFEPNQQQEGTTLTWDVTFDTTEARRTFLWQAVTERTITDTCNNFQAAVAMPQVYQRDTMVRSKEEPKLVMAQWVKFCWEEGGGFPLPIPPIRFDDDSRWIVPPFLNEKLVSTQTKENGVAEVNYRVENPSQFTYQVYSHRGRVRFYPNDNDDSLQMKWEVEIRPYPEPWVTIVKAFTAAVVSAYARNFKCHIREGSNVMVSLKPPRGASDSTLLQVRKDSWVGGVLDAHLNDKRSTVDQTLAILQPWTWGRTADDDEEGEGEEWTEGYLSE